MSAASLEQQKHDDVLILRLRGSLDHHGVDLVGDAFTDAAAQAGRVVVDLAGLDVMNTPGIAMILGSHRALRQAGGRLVLTGATGVVSDLLRRCRLDAVLTLAPTETEAVAWAKAT